MPVLIALAAASVAAASPDAPASAPAEDGPLFTISGYVSDGGEDAQGGWFQLHDQSIRYRLPRATPAETEIYWGLLHAAAETGVALRVRYDGAAGRADPEAGLIDYPLCALSTNSGAS